MNIMLNFRKFHPGVYIKDSLDALEMTAREFSIRTGISERTLSAIINGEGNVTFDVAYKLAKFFDDSVEVWMNLQSQYDTYIRGKLIQEEIDKKNKKYESYLKKIFSYNTGLFKRMIQKM